MKTENELREMLNDVNDRLAKTAWWDEESEALNTAKAVILWALGDADSGFIETDEKFMGD